MNDRIRVLVVDDHPMFTDAIEALLAAKEDIEVAGVASTAVEALERCRADPPDVVLMDLDLPGVDGIGATRSIKQEHPECEVLMVSAFRNDEAVARSMEAGAIGYVPKTEAADRLVHAVRSAVA
jgi:DNA-binding NarL/FixJ family response regulator